MTKYDLSVGCIVVNSSNDFLLMQKAADGLWDFPKGHVKEGDRDEQAVAMRELEEETGINAAHIKVIVGFRNEHTFVNNNGTPRKIVLFLARCDREPNMSDEHTAYMWANLSKAKELMRFREKQQALDEAFAFLQKNL